MENVEVCCKAWYIIHGLSKAAFNRFQIYSSQGRHSSVHDNIGTKKPKEATCQVIATLSTIIMPLVDVMSHKTKTLSSRERVVQMVLSA